MGGPAPERACPDSRRRARGQGVLNLPRRLAKRLRRELETGTGFILILDYDGTLTPLVPSPEAATLAPSLRRTLKRLAASPRTRVAILSGRSLSDIKDRVGLAHVVYAGCHGLEIRGRGLRFAHPHARRGSWRVRAMARTLGRQLRRFPGAFLEVKGLTVSLHYRRVPRGRRGDLVRLATRLKREAGGLEILSGKHVLEFMPRVNWGKGKAALWIARRLAPSLRSRRAVILYAGDDATDETAFAALKGRGITIRVGAERGGADYAVRNVRGVHTLLRWIAQASG